MGGVKTMYSELGPTKASGPPVRAIRTKPVPAFEMERIIDLKRHESHCQVHASVHSYCKAIHVLSHLMKKQHNLLTHQAVSARLAFQKAEASPVGTRSRVANQHYKSKCVSWTCNVTGTSTFNIRILPCWCYSEARHPVPRCITEAIINGNRSRGAMEEEHPHI